MCNGNRRNVYSLVYFTERLEFVLFTLIKFSMLAELIEIIPLALK